MATKTKTMKGRWWDITIKGKVSIIPAKYDRLKDWRMDPKSYFLIRLNPQKKLIEVAYCSFPDHVLRGIVKGKSAIEVVNTLIHKKMISTLQHAADMGIELCKAETALKLKIKYVQDGSLELR